MPSRLDENQFVRKLSGDYTATMNMLLCPHCQTPVPDSATVCRGCGAEIVRGASRGQRALIGVAFVIAAMLVGAVVLCALEIVRGAPPLPAPKAEDGFLVLLALITVIFVPYVVGARIARLLWRSRIRFCRRYQHQ
jgi:predicted nucleic acid-binding Zn ribbon protein